MLGGDGGEILGALAALRVIYLVTDWVQVLVLKSASSFPKKQSRLRVTDPRDLEMTEGEGNADMNLSPLKSHPKADVHLEQRTDSVEVSGAF